MTDNLSSRCSPWEKRTFYKEDCFPILLVRQDRIRASSFVTSRNRGDYGKREYGIFPYHVTLNYDSFIVFFMNCMKFRENLNERVLTFSFAYKQSWQLFESSRSRESMTIREEKLDFIRSRAILHENSSQVSICHRHIPINDAMSISNIYGRF